MPKKQVEQLCASSVMLYISTKFSEIIWNGIKVIDLYSKGNNSAKNVGGVTLVNLCTSSGHALYF